jgi:hypothetical protein
MKTIASLFFATVLAIGVLFVASPAEAAYPKSIATSCSAVSTKLHIKKSGTPRIAFSARAKAGNGRPTGTVRVTFVKNGVAVRSVTRKYTGDTVYSFKPLRKGSYSIGARLVTPKTSVFKGCRDGAKLFVS